MWLYCLEVKNYRSLEDVKLDHLQQFNVLIGQNNAGKSAVFGALQGLNAALTRSAMLLEGGQQVFITTHSSVFINLTRPYSLYQVTYSEGVTAIKRCDAASLEAVLEDIGVRNSDVLLSDAVLFVEGTSDRD